GSLKLTIQKFYRVNGGSTQYRGVSADVVLPDQLAYYEIGEIELDNYLSYDTIRPVAIKKWDEKINIAAIKAKSVQRVKNNPVFNYINKHISLLEKQKRQTLLSLQMQKIIAEQEALTKQTEELKNIQKEKSYLRVREVGKASENIEWVKQINKDEYIEEALLVLNDLAQ
ncbi:MAG: carboxy terminal-processing peptidase, partial [Desulfobacterota bacterium]|nr:carboxy terminal-processing peptidase [Thermodesulfobacteriota bacterium]